MFVLDVNLQIEHHPFPYDDIRMAEQLPPELLASCDTNHGPMLLVFAWLFLAFAIITVFLRLYFRHFYRNGLHLDDLVMLASLVRYPPLYNKPSPRMPLTAISNNR